MKNKGLNARHFNNNVKKPDFKDVPTTIVTCIFLFDISVVKPSSN